MVRLRFHLFSNDIYARHDHVAGMCAQVLVHACKRPACEHDMIARCFNQPCCMDLSIFVSHSSMPGHPCCSWLCMAVHAWFGPLRQHVPCMAPILLNLEMLSAEQFANMIGSRYIFARNLHVGQIIQQSLAWPATPFLEWNTLGTTVYLRHSLCPGYLLRSLPYLVGDHCRYSHLLHDMPLVQIHKLKCLHCMQWQYIPGVGP